MSFFGFLANLEQSEGWIPDTESAEIMFSVTVTLSYKNWKQNYKVFNTALTLLLWVNANFLQKNADISKIKGT